MQLKATSPKAIIQLRYHWNVMPLDQREPVVLGSPVTVVAKPTFSGKVTRPVDLRVAP